MHAEPPILRSGPRGLWYAHSGSPQRGLQRTLLHAAAAVAVPGTHIRINCLPNWMQPATFQPARPDRRGPSQGCRSLWQWPYCKRPPLRPVGRFLHNACALARAHVWPKACWRKARSPGAKLVSSAPTRSSSHVISLDMKAPATRRRNSCSLSLGASTCTDGHGISSLRPQPFRLGPHRGQEVVEVMRHFNWHVFHKKDQQRTKCNEVQALSQSRAVARVQTWSHDPLAPCRWPVPCWPMGSWPHNSTCTRQLAASTTELRADTRRRPHRWTALADFL